jgi:hypothetical protein
MAMDMVDDEVEGAARRCREVEFDPGAASGAQRAAVGVLGGRFDRPFGGDAPRRAERD